MPQTPWIVDGVKRMPTSVEEIIIDNLKADLLGFDEAKFASSGREDVDVRMLGRGRPFLFEVTNPRKTRFEDFSAAAERICENSDGVRVRDLQIVRKSDTKLLKDGEDSKTKVYTALCTLPRSRGYTLESIRERLEELKDVELDQKTPIRVLHRRPNAVRKRSVYWMRVQSCGGLESGGFVVFKLKLATQAGTYVKEFVHGDFGRTMPNLRTILDCQEVDIVALDVEEIELDWPPKLVT